MADYFIENESIKAGFTAHGAELVTLINKATQSELLWCGDSTYWGRVSPVLFPFIGKLTNQEYRYNNKSYSNVPQHGYARDSVFSLESNTGSEIWFSLKPDAQWFERYPFSFELRLGYKLEGNKLHVMWNVNNSDSKTIYFSIGAHPAFACGEAGTEDPLNGYSLNFYTNSSTITCELIDENGVLSKNTTDISLTNGILKLSNSLFDDDALVITPNGINSIGLINTAGKEIIKVDFDTPQLGIWSPARKNAPFVCIEPWFGRCDRAGFSGDISEREYGNSLEPGHSFNKEYVISVM